VIALFSRLGLLSLALALWAPPAAACTASATPTYDLGSYSPAAIKGLAVPPVGKSGGINCSGISISLLGGNVLTATLSNTNQFKLTSPGLPDGAFEVYPSATSQTAIASGVAVNLLSPVVVDLVGLLGNSPSSIPLYIKPVSTVALLPGVYNGSFRVTWTWKFCSGAWVLGSCTLGTLTQGTQAVDIAFTVTVAPRPLTIAMSSVTTWDPIAGTSFPKSIVGAKKRVTLVVTNPDIVATDLNSVRVEIGTQPGTAIALEGDGASIGNAIKFTDGSPSSTLAFSYTTTNDYADDVDFYSAGAGWTYVPTPGDATTQRAVTKVRLKPRGKLAALSSFTITIPYAIN
jgi:hypothetical protein